MADLIAIGYDDETTAAKAEAEAERLAQDLLIQPDAVAVIVCNQKGKFKVQTNHHAVGAMMGKVAKIGIDESFQSQVRDMLTPGTSALFMVVEKVTPDKAIEALSQYGGTVLKSSLSHDAERELQEYLHGEAA